MRESLAATVEPVKSKDIFSKNIENVVNSLEALINSKTASLPEEGVNEARKMWRTLVKWTYSKTSVINLLLDAKQLREVGESSRFLLTKYKDFFNESECQLLNEVYSISSSGTQLIEGIHFLYKTEETDDHTAYLNNVAAGISLISKGLRKYPGFVSLQNYKVLKALGEDTIETTKISETAQLNQELTLLYENYKELIYLNAVSVLWLVEEFEKTIENEKDTKTNKNTQDESKSRKIPWEEEEDFINLLIDIGEESHNTDSPEEIEEFEKFLKNLGNA